MRVRARVRVGVRIKVSVTVISIRVRCARSGPVSHCAVHLVQGDHGSEPH